MTSANVEGTAGGAERVQLKSWDELIRYPAVDKAAVRANMKQLVGVCRASNVPTPPEFEVRYFASMMALSNIDIQPTFPCARVLESTMFVHWVFCIGQVWS